MRWFFSLEQFYRNTYVCDLMLRELSMVCQMVRRSCEEHSTWIRQCNNHPIKFIDVKRNHPHSKQTAPTLRKKEKKTQQNDMETLILIYQRVWIMLPLLVRTMKVLLNCYTHTLAPCCRVCHMQFHDFPSGAFHEMTLLPQRLMSLRHCAWSGKKVETCWGYKIKLNA